MMNDFHQQFVAIYGGNWWSFTVSFDSSDVYTIQRCCPSFVPQNVSIIMVEQKTLTIVVVFGN